ncbi:MAG: hypothetical protein B7Z81_09050 [Acidocella sp. 20-61-6]|nr:MAG: hypothetical protein B7Z81_09050 [Acidocella sp. 20-61-6]
MQEYFFEDFAAGQRTETEPVAISEAEIIEFAGKYDPQPMHTDPQAAETITGGLIASGWHTASLTMRLWITGTPYRPAPGSVGLGFDKLRWLKPVRPGDTLRLQLEILGTRASESKPDRGIVTIRFVTVNQHGEPVLDMTSSAIVPKRNAG